MNRDLMPSGLAQLQLTFTEDKTKVLSSLTGSEVTYTDSTHRYYGRYSGEKGNPLKSVTTITSGLLASHKLEGWKINQIATKVYDLAREGVSLVSALKQAKAIPRNIMREAGTIGSATHKAAECYLRNKPYQLHLTDPTAKDCFDRFKAYWEEEVANNNKSMLLNELPVWSMELGVAGLIDIVIDTPSGVTIVDIKTSAGIYRDHLIQLGGYAALLEEQTGLFPEGLILSIPKGSSDVKPVTLNKAVMKNCAQAFKASLFFRLWKDSISSIVS